MQSNKIPVCYFPKVGRTRELNRFRDESRFIPYQCFAVGLFFSNNGALYLLHKCGLAKKEDEEFTEMCFRLF